MLYNTMMQTDNIDEAWLYWYNLLLGEKSIMPSRDGDVVGEVINAITVITDPTKNIMKNNVRNLSMKYAIGEMLWYLSGNKNM